MERAAKRFVVPIYGVGAGVAGAPPVAVTGKVSPGPLVWWQTRDSFVESLKDGGKAELSRALRNVGATASPGGGVT